MIFTTLLQQFFIFRSRLATINEDIKISEIASDIPEKDNDELSFQKLVAWSYIFQYEISKTHIKFFKSLSEIQTPNHIHALRTCGSHNVSLDSNRNLKIRKEAFNWFETACGRISPNTPEEWKKCFDSLANDMIALIYKLTDSCKLLEDANDGEHNLQELQKRIKKHWDGYQFDEYVKYAINSLGYDGIEVIEFRNQHLKTWRELVQTSTDEGIDTLLKKRVEVDLLTHMSNSLGYTFEELSSLLNLKNKESLQVFVLLIKNCDAKNMSFNQIIDEVVKSIPENHV